MLIAKRIKTDSIKPKFDNSFCTNREHEIVFILTWRTCRKISGSVFVLKKVNQQRMGCQILE